jgi:hypothetical protein
MGIKTKKSYFSTGAHFLKWTGSGSEEQFPVGDAGLTGN